MVRVGSRVQFPSTAPLKEKTWRMAEPDKTSYDSQKFLAYLKGGRYQTDRHTQYYIDLYQRFGLNQTGFLSWNWSVFFLALFDNELYWFLYRRMYLYAVIGFFLKTFFVGGILFIGANWHGEVLFFKFSGGLFRMAVSLFLGVFSSAIYFHFLKKKMTRYQEVVRPGTDFMTPTIFFLVQTAYTSMVFSYLKHNPQVLGSLLGQFFPK